MHLMAGQQECSTKANPPTQVLYVQSFIAPFTLTLGTSFGAVLDMVTDRYA